MDQSRVLPASALVSTGMAACVFRARPPRGRQPSAWGEPLVVGEAAGATRPRLTVTRGHRSRLFLLRYQPWKRKAGPLWSRVVPWSPEKLLCGTWGRPAYPARLCCSVTCFTSFPVPTEAGETSTTKPRPLWFRKRSFAWRASARSPSGHLGQRREFQNPFLGMCFVFCFFKYFRRPDRE